MSTAVRSYLLKKLLTIDTLWSLQPDSYEVGFSLTVPYASSKIPSQSQVQAHCWLTWLSCPLDPGRLWWGIWGHCCPLGTLISNEQKRSDDSTARPQCFDQSFQRPCAAGSGLSSLEGKVLGHVLDCSWLRSGQFRGQKGSRPPRKTPRNVPLYVLPAKKNNIPDFQNQRYINS